MIAFIIEKLFDDEKELVLTVSAKSNSMKN